MDDESFNQHGRYHASERYPLPSDADEIERLNLQHPFIVKAFENRLALAPLDLKSEDRILESVAGTGICALEFFEENKQNGVILNIECTDISNKPFPQNIPSSNIQFSVYSVTDLPASWTSTFSYVQQRLVMVSMNDSTSRKAISELLRVLVPGGWMELVEIEIQDVHYAAGPSSTKLQSIWLKIIEEKGFIGNINNYLPPLLEKAGFMDVHCETRNVPIGHAYEADVWGKFWNGLKGDVLGGGGYGAVETEKEYEELVKEAVREWKTFSNKAFITYYTILARKP